MKIDNKNDELEEYIIEEYLEKEKIRTQEENQEVEKRLEDMYQKLIAGLEKLDSEIIKAKEEGDESLWIILNNKKSIVLQNLFEIKKLLKR